MMQTHLGHTHLLLREGRVMGVTETALPFGCITASVLNSTKHVFTPNFRTHRKEDFRRASNAATTERSVQGEAIYLLPCSDYTKG